MIPIMESCAGELAPTSLSMMKEKLRKQPDKWGQQPRLNGYLISVQCTATRRSNGNDVIPCLNQGAIPIVAQCKNIRRWMGNYDSLPAQRNDAEQAH